MSFNSLSRETESTAPIRVLGVYEDLPSGLRVSRLCAHVIEKFDHTVPFETDLCSFDLLMLPGAAQTASLRAKRADAIILSAHRRSSIPRRVRNWIETLPSRSVQNRAAWIELFDEEPGDHSPGEEILEQLAAKARLEDQRMARETNAAQDRPPAELDTEPSLLFVEQGSARDAEGWGINES